MSYYTIQATKTIQARPELIYDIIADYHDGHQQILPRRYFKEMIVDEGGKGVGTKLTIHMSAFGTNTILKQTVTEGVRGRLLVEENDNGTVTKFIIKPLNDGIHAEVTIDTKGKIAPGLRGRIEGWLSPRLLKKIYREELAMLDAVARKKANMIG
jgi:hypothetical protein